jgi:peptide/nickel transport system permease protein
MNYDYPVIMGTGVIAVFLTLAGILISDLFYAMADPRIRLGGGER